MHNSSTDQEFEGDQQASELPILSEEEKLPETSYHALPLVSETTWLQIVLLTIAVLPFAAGSRYETNLGD
jgi:hypothetical protein